MHTMIVRSSRAKSLCLLCRMQVFACFPVLHLQAYYSVMKHGWLIPTRHILCPAPLLVQMYQTCFWIHMDMTFQAFIGAKAAQVRRRETKGGETEGRLLPLVFPFIRSIFYDPEGTVPSVNVVPFTTTASSSVVNFTYLSASMPVGRM